MSKLMFQPGTYRNDFNEQMLALGQDVGFIATYNTPEKRRNFYHGKVASMFQDNLGTHPFKQIPTDDGSIQFEFDEKAKSLDYIDDDTPKEEIMKDFYNSFVTNKGVLPENNFLERTFTNSMTGGYNNMLGNPAQALGVGGRIMFTEEGIKYKGDMLQLNPNEMEVLSKYAKRINADDREKSFLEKTAETFMSLTWDLPLMMASGVATSGILKGVGAATKLGPVIQSMMKSENIGVKISGELLRQGITFNILGIPQTAESIKDKGATAGIGEIWHNIQMGAFATMTGQMGRGTVSGLGLASSVIKEQLRHNPALAKELGAIGGGAFFGTGSSLIAGESWEDALAHGLAFAGTHFASPRAYKAIMRDAKRSNIRVRVSDRSTRDDVAYDDYFVEDIDGNVYKIDPAKFNKEGKVEKTSTEPVEITKENDAQYPYINEVESSMHKSFGRLLSMEKLKSESKKLTNRWIASGDISRKKYRKNKYHYDKLASDIIISAVSDKIEKSTYKDIKVPENAELNDMMIKISNDVKVPYSKIKDLLVREIDNYKKNPEAVIEELTRLMPAEEVVGPKPIDIETPLQKKERVAKEQSDFVKGIIGIFDKAIDIDKINENRQRIDKAISKILLEKPKVITKTPELEKEIVKERKEQIEKKEKEVIKQSDIGPLKEVLYKRRYKAKEIENIITKISPEEAKYVITKGKLGEEISREKLKEYASAEKEKAVIEPEKLKEEKAVEPVPKEDVIKDVEGERREKPAVEPIEREEGRDPTPEERELEGIYTKAKTLHEELQSIDLEISNLEAEKVAEDQILAGILDNKNLTHEQKVEYIESTNRKKEIIDKGIAELSKEKLLTEDIRKSIGEEIPIDIGKEARGEIKKKTFGISKEAFPEAPLKIDRQTIVEAREESKTVASGEKWRTFTKRIGIDKEVAFIADIMDKLRVEPLRLDEKGKRMEEDVSIYDESRRGIFYKDRSYTGGDAVVEFLHESIHALTLDKRFDNKEFRGWYNNEVAPELNKVLSHIKTVWEKEKLTNTNIHLSNAIEYMLNPYKKKIDARKLNPADMLVEIASVAFSSPDAAAYLSNIQLPFKVSGIKKGGNVFDWFNKKYRQVVDKILGDVEGIDETFVKDNALDAMYKIMDKAIDNMSKENKDLLDVTKDRDLSKVTDTRYLQEEVNLMDYHLTRLGSGDAKSVDTATMITKRRNEAVKRLEELTPDKSKEEMESGEIPIQTPPGLGTPEPGGPEGVDLGQTYGKHELGGTFRKSQESLRNMYGKDAEDIGRESVREANRTRDESDFKVQAPPSIESEKSNAKQLNKELDNILGIRGEGIDVKDKSVWRDVSRNVATKIGGNFKNYLKYNLPPVHFAERSEAFRKIYEHGEAMKSNTTRDINRMLYGEDYWHNEAKWNKVDKTIIENFLGKVQEYETSIYKEEIDRLGWDEFAEWSGVNKDPNMRETFNAYRRTLEESTNVMIDGFAESKAVFDTDLHKQLSMTEVTKELKSFPGDLYEETYEKARDASKIYKESQKEKGDKILKSNGKEAWISFQTKISEKSQKIEHEIIREELNEQFKADPQYKKDIAKGMVQESFKDWNKYFYYNSSRPTNPNVYHIKAVKKGSEVSEFISDLYGLGGKEDVLTYAENRAEYERIISSFEQSGYEIVPEETFKVGEVIKNKTYHSKLSELQLMELANAGHIPLDNEIIKKLINTTKTGVHVHEINKRYVPGMKYTESEFKNQLTRFVRESVYSGTKPYHLRSMEDHLAKWNNEINTKIGTMSEAEKVKALGEWKYAQGYINQMKQPEKTWLDEARFMGITWQVGFLKPSFLVQQLTQVVQTGFPQMKMAAQEIGVDQSIANTAFLDATSQALGLGMGLRSLKKGKTVEEAIDIKQYGSAKERQDAVDKLKMMQQLEWSEKIAATGISEMASLSPELDYKYQKGARKHFESFKKVMTYTGKAVEKMTRTHVASAFYDIGYSKGMRGEPLYEFIAKNIDKSMGEWGKGGRAPLLYSRQPGVIDNQFIHGLRKGLLTYKTFSFYNYGQWTELMKGSQKSALFAKSMVGLGLHGLYAFPLMSGIFTLADAFTDDDTSVDYEMYKLSDEMDKLIPGVDVGKIVSKGILAQFGIDMSDMFSEDTPLLTDVYARAFGNSWEDKVDNVLQGASIGFTREMLESSRDLLGLAVDQLYKDGVQTSGDEEKVSKLVQKMSPAAIKNVWKAMNWEKDGIEYRGGQLIAKDDLTISDILLKTMSFPLYKTRRVYEAYKYDALNNYNYYRRMAEAAVEQAKEIRAKEDMPEKAKSNEIKRFIKLKEEYRDKASAVRGEAFDIKRERKIRK